MSEKFIKTRENSTNNNEHMAVKNAETANLNRHEHKDNISEIRHTLEQHSKSSEQISNYETNEDVGQPTHHYITKKIKATKFKETMSVVQSQLKPVNRRLSRIIHQTAVETISEVGSKTIARPSGIIGGGIISLVGSSLAIIVAKKIGFEIPHSLFLILFVCGFILGLFVEYIIRLICKFLQKRKRIDKETSLV
jgi:hypothetical protein